MLGHLSTLNESENVSKSIGNLPCKVRKANIEKIMNDIRNQNWIAKELLELSGKRVIHLLEADISFQSYRIMMYK